MISGDPLFERLENLAYLMLNMLAWIVVMAFFGGLGGGLLVGIAWLSGIVS